MARTNREILTALQRSRPFILSLREKYPWYFQAPYLTERDAEDFMQILHHEFRAHAEIDPLPDASLNLMEDQIIPAEQNVVIHPMVNDLPAFVHYTNYFELKYVAEGTAHYLSDKSHITLCSGDVLIIPPNVRQCFYFEDHALCYNILIRASTFEIAFFHLLSHNDALSDFFTQSLYGNVSDFLLWHCGKNTRLKRQILRCEKEFYSLKPYGVRMAEVIVSEILIELLRCDYALEGRSKFVSDQKAQTLETVQKYLLSHLQDASIHEAAVLCGYSDRQMERIIKEATGLSFMQLLQQIRIQRAKEGLKNPAIRISDLASALGYSSEAYFTKRFRTQTGCTPREYRTAHLNAEAR